MHNVTVSAQRQRYRPLLWLLVPIAALGLMRGGWPLPGFVLLITSLGLGGLHAALRPATLGEPAVFLMQFGLGLAAAGLLIHASVPYGGGMAPALAGFCLFCSLLQNARRLAHERTREAVGVGLLRVAVWVVAVGVIAGCHARNEQQMRRVADRLRVAVSAYQTRYGCYPPSLDALGPPWNRPVPAPDINQDLRFWYDPGRASDRPRVGYRWPGGLVPNGCSFRLGHPGETWTCRRG